MTPHRANIIFNTCRESGDHWPLSSWDRQPFSMAGPVPAVTATWQNLIFADYQGVKGMDHGAVLRLVSVFVFVYVFSACVCAASTPSGLCCVSLTNKLVSSPKFALI